MSKRPRLCFVTAVPMTVSSFLSGHIVHLSASYDVYVVSDFSGQKIELEGVECISVPIPRHIALLSDLKALVLLWRVFREYRFDITISVTPKAGLLSALAGFLSRIPVRIHWFTGQVWVTQQGVMRQLLKALDKLTATLNTQLLADSLSQKDFLVAESICKAKDIEVIANGSICGVDSVRFCPNTEARAAIRLQHHIAPQAKVVLFLGRLNIDKGLNELAQAIPIVCNAVPNVAFLIVGPDEENMSVAISQAAGDYIKNVYFQGFTKNPEQYMAAADVFCLPSYREGFGSSVLEAAACGVPAVATNIYGLIDAVADGITGVLVPPRDANSLANTLIKLLKDDTQRQLMGQQARIRAMNDFSQQIVVLGLSDYLEQATRSAP